ncbi:MAG: hypothetical protein ATN36_05600 [Epulopiscium sp. Nele67-Bin005]|nr:MAG: hypothetical protein ATN36_05600 [Epulopiscium sp. Nele67-Bin005]
MNNLIEWATLLKIRYKIIFINTFILIIPLIGVIFAFSRLHKSFEIEQETISLETNLTRISENLNLSQQIAQMTMQSILLDNTLKQYVQKITDNQVISLQETMTFNTAYISSIDRIVYANPYIHDIKIYIEGEFLEIGTRLYNASRYKNQDYISNLKESVWNFGVSNNFEYYRREDVDIFDVDIIILTAPYIDMSRKQVGIVEISIPTQYVIQEINNENMFFLGESQFLNGFDLNQLGVIQTPDALIGYVYIEELNDFIVKVNSLDFMNKKISKMANIILVLICVLVIIVTLVINKTTTILFKNFYEILDAIKNIQQGNFDIRLRDFGQGEMGELGESINILVDNIDSLMEDIVARELMVKDSEIKALQNQINAHFIYNVLEAIKMKAEIEGVYEVSDSLTHLGKLLRYSIKTDFCKVKLYEEINYIESYISLMNFRHDYDITLQLQISPEILNKEIPKMSIQPLVENALLHGFSQLDGKSSLYIVCKEDSPTSFTIEVLDFGCGMSNETVDILNQRINGKILSHKDRGIGLKNVQDRIKILFGEEYGLNIKSQQDSFTKVILRLPL